MDQIAASHITLPDLLIWGVAIFLFFRLRTLPPNSATCRLVAALCGCMVVAIVAVILLADNLSSIGVMELAMIAIWLCIGLSRWNDARSKSTLASDLL